MSASDRFRYVNLFTRREKAYRLAWEIAWLLLFRPTPRWACHAWRRQLLRIFGARIGKGSKIAPSCRVWAPWNLTVGEYTALGENVDCYSMDRIVIGSMVTVSQRSFLCAGSHRIDSIGRELITQPISIGDFVWIAAESFIRPGVGIGEGCVIGARSVVTKDLPPWTICAGHPCRPVKERQMDPQSKQALNDLAARRGAALCGSSEPNAYILTLPSKRN